MLANQRVEGSDVIQSMREWYSVDSKTGKKKELNVCTLKSMATKIKRAAMLALKQDDLHESFSKKGAGRAKLEQLKASTPSKSCARQIDQFLESDTPYKAKIVAQKRSKNGQKNLCSRFDDKNVLEVFAQIEILPANFASFRISSAELGACKKTSKLARLRKARLDLTGKDVGNMLRHAEEVLSTPETSRKEELLLALMFASGRRSAEIFNGRSHFEQIPSFPSGCRFQGQLKSSKDMNELRFKIPLLVPFKTFEHGLGFYRGWQQRNGEDVSKLPNSVLSKRYQGNLSRHVKEHPFGGVSIPKAHAMRSIYAKLALNLFKYPYTEYRLAKYILGHATDDEQLSYAHVHVTSFGKHKHKLGTLPVDDDELTMAENLSGGDELAEEEEEEEEMEQKEDNKKAKHKNNSKGHKKNKTKADVVDLSGAPLSPLV